MPWPRFGPSWARRNEASAAATTETSTVTSEALVAAAATINTNAVRQASARLVGNEQGWQIELWDYFEACGEYGLAVNWRANMISRVRLRAAEVLPGLDEPRIVDDGPAADLVHELFSNVGGQSAAMATLSTYLDVPGEGWVVGEQRGGREVWRTYSSDEIRGRSDWYEVIDERSMPGRIIWRDLARDALVVRVWRPHRRWYHQPYSPARSALSAIRELDLVNRHIQAQYLSRLASAGIIVLPDELTFPVREEFNDAPDPFVAEWIATAKEAVATPGTAAAVVPIPMRVPAEYVDKVKHIDFTLKLDEKIIEKRDAARTRLASIINVPTELLFNSGSINHWGLWQLEESGVKTYLTPDVELIVNALTIGYLEPRLRAMGEDPSRWVVWYDASEIITRPDMTDSVIKAYDRGEVPGRTLRRVIGLDEDDKPSSEELEAMILTKLAFNPTTGFLALHNLTGFDPDVPDELTPKPSQAEAPVKPNDAEAPADGPPDTQHDQPRTPRSANADADRTAFTLLQAKSQHVLHFGPEGYQLKHPLICQPKLFSCPFTHVTYDGVRVHPGTSGDYECVLSATGELSIGRRVFPSADAFVVDQMRGTNGVAVLN
jgi:hypothetical protein